MKHFIAILTDPNGKISTWLNLGTMYSKYAIAVLLLFITWKWEYFIPFCISIVLSFIFGVIIHGVMPKQVWLVKYVVTLTELSVIQVLTNSIIGNRQNLILTSIFTLPLILNFFVELTEHSSLSIPKKGVGRVFYLMSGNLFGVERVAKFTLGAYYSFVFGLASLTNEIVLLWAFGLIGASEYDPLDLLHTGATKIRDSADKVCKKCEIARYSTRIKSRKEV